jgi:hypothetical protein
MGNKKPKRLRVGADKLRSIGGGMGVGLGRDETAVSCENCLTVVSDLRDDCLGGQNRSKAPPLSL